MLTQHLNLLSNRSLNLFIHIYIKTLIQISTDTHLYFKKKEVFFFKFIYLKRSCMKNRFLMSIINVFSNQQCPQDQQIFRFVLFLSIRMMLEQIFESSQAIIIIIIIIIIINGSPNLGLKTRPYNNRQKKKKENLQNCRLCCPD